MWRVSLPVLLFLPVALGCGSAEEARKYPLHGKVLLDGKPMQKGEIAFFPETPGTPPAVVEVNDGVYSTAALMGKSRVEIRKYKRMPPENELENYLPAQYNTKSRLTAQVTPDGLNEFNFEVTEQ